MFSIKILEMLKVAHRDESGVTLLETLAATAIAGVVIVSMLGGMSIAARSDFTITILSTAEALAISQLEHTKSADYINYSTTGHGEYVQIDVPTGYEIEVSCSPVSPSSGQPLGTGEDDGVQLITVVVRHEGEQVALLKGFKVNR